MKEENRLQDPLELFRVYCAVKAHFSSKYNFVEYQGKINISRESLEKRKDRYFFEKLSFMLNKTDSAPFFVAQFIEDENLYIADIILNYETAMEKYKKWKCRIEMLWENFNIDICYIYDYIESNRITLMDLMITKHNSHNPLLMNLLISRKINPETYTLLNKAFNFVDVNMKAKMKDDIIYEAFNNKFVRYGFFLLTTPDDIKAMIKKIKNARTSRNGN